MLRYKVINRKPIVWEVSFGDKVGLVTKTGDSDRSLRWKLETPDMSKTFTSRRAAFHFFKTGEKFETKPVYATRAKGGQKRIR